MESTIPAAATDAFVQHAAREALVDDDRRLTFAQYGEQARLVARSLLGVGIGRGDRVAAWAPNSLDHAVFVLGVHLAGATFVPVNTRFKIRETAQVLIDARVRLVLTVDSFLGVDHAAQLSRAAASDKGLGQLDLRIASVGEGGVRSWPDMLGDPVADSVLKAASAAVTPDDIATILFTSGTTGRPKGAMLRHGALVRGYREWCALTGMVEGDRVLVSNPFFHAFGLHVGLLGPLLLGATACPVPVFDADRVSKLMLDESISYYPAPPDGICRPGRPRSCGRRRPLP